MNHSFLNWLTIIINFVRKKAKRKPYTEKFNSLYIVESCIVACYNTTHLDIDEIFGEKSGDGLRSKVNAIATRSVSSSFHAQTGLDTEDITQEVMLRILRRVVKASQQQSSSLSFYISASQIRLLVDWTVKDELRRARAQGRDKAASLDEADCAGVIYSSNDPARIVESRIERQELFTQLSSVVGESSAELLWRHYGQEESYAELSSRMNITPETARQQASRAKRKIEQSVGV